MKITIEVLNEKPIENDPFIINGNFDDPIKIDRFRVEYVDEIQEYVSKDIGDFIVSAKSGTMYPLRFCWKIKIN